MLSSRPTAVGAGSVLFGSAGVARIPFAGLRAPGTYITMITVEVGGNRVNPDVKLIDHRSAAAAASRRAHGSAGASR